jgi:hypothetical protein
MTKTPMAGPGLAESIPFPAPAWALVAREFRAEALKILPPPHPPSFLSLLFGSFALLSL